ncbi:hypothetical protein ALC152_07500 [Arcobacter sp. 15-2]|uniref:hypothetical protein n=1 Tax=Arcobacter sp. 15-2 TaxID=3374109 RepID=UPI00399D2998
MHTLTLNIKNSAYDKIAYFLQNVSNDVEIVNHNIEQDVNLSMKKNVNLRGVFNSYANIEKYKKENDALKNHIVEQYKKDN